MVEVRLENNLSDKKATVRINMLLLNNLLFNDLHVHKKLSVKWHFNNKD